MCASSADPLEILSPEACFDAFYGIDPDTRASWIDSDFRLYPTMPVELRLFVGGIQVASLEGVVAAVNEWDEDVRGLYVARFQGEK